MGSALDARGIKSSPDNLVGHVEGIIENVDDEIMSLPEAAF